MTYRVHIELEYVDRITFETETNGDILEEVAKKFSDLDEVIKLVKASKIVQIRSKIYEDGGFHSDNQISYRDGKIKIVETDEDE